MDPDDDDLPLDGGDDPLEDQPLALADDDEDELPPEDEDDAQVGDEPPPRRSRERNRNQRLANENRELRQRLERLESRSAPAQTFPNPADQARLQREEDERVQLMSPAEAAKFYYEKGQREFGQQLRATQFQTHDLADRSDFDQLCRDDPAAQRMRDKVLARLKQERDGGNLGTSRRAIFYYLRGEAISESPRKPRERQRQNGERRVAAERVNPPAAPRGQQGGQRTPVSEREARRQRLLKETF